MLEVDGVKASTASDPLDVLPAARTFIAVMCKNRNNKKRVLEINTLNRIELNLKNPNRPSPIKNWPICRQFGTGAKVWHGHYTTSAELSRHFRPVSMVPKCLGSDVSVH